MGAEQHPVDADRTAEILGSSAIIIDNFGIDYIRNGKVSTAIRDVSLAIPQGEITAFIGNSGCGKTTLLKSMNRLLETNRDYRVQHHGRMDVKIHGQWLDVYGDRAVELLRMNVGMVFQMPFNLPGDINNNLDHGQNFRAVSKRLRPYNALSLLSRVGLLKEIDGAYNPETDGPRQHGPLRTALLDLAAGLNLIKGPKSDALTRNPNNMSGGQIQRLALARALTAEPEILLLDEPCSQLDPNATTKIEEQLMEMAGLGMTIIVVTHNLFQAQRIAKNTAYFMNDWTPEGYPLPGRLVEFGPTEKIFSQDAMPETWNYVKNDILRR